MVELPELVLRAVPVVAVPQFAVVWRRPGGGGEDVAWFFDRDLAEEYVGIYAGQGIKPGRQGKGKTACSPK